MYAVGSFTQISGSNGTSTQTFTRNNIFSFSATAPFAVTSWDPNVNGAVNSIALSSDCNDAYIGGQFTSVDGTTVPPLPLINARCRAGSASPARHHLITAAACQSPLIPRI